MGAQVRTRLVGNGWWRTLFIITDEANLANGRVFYEDGQVVPNLDLTGFIDNQCLDWNPVCDARELK